MDSRSSPLFRKTGAAEEKPGSGSDSDHVDAVSDDEVDEDDEL